MIPFESPQRGRPVDRQKDLAIVDAAKTLFLHQGFAKTTIEQVARAAGVSKVTIYARFGDKETLFEQVVLAKVGEIEAHMALDPDDDRPLAERLTALGATLMRFLLSAELLLFDGILVTEVRRVPGLGKRFFGAGPGRKRAQLTAIIARAAERGELAVDDPMRAAEDLLSLWLGFIHVQMKFGILPALDPATIEEKAARGVRLFMKAHAP